MDVSNYNADTHYHLMIVRLGGMFRIKTVKGGTVAEELSGAYTTVEDAKKEILRYFLPRAPKAKGSVGRPRNRPKFKYKTRGRPTISYLSGRKSPSNQIQRSRKAR